MTALDSRSLTITPGGQAQFRFPFEEALIAELKARVAGVAWNGSLRAWTVRAMPANIRAISAFAREYDFSGALEAEVTQGRMFEAVRETMKASRAADAEFATPASLRGSLRPFQRAGVAFAVAARRCLIADEMGLGKTVEAIATLEALDAFPAVIVCPASLKHNWRAELNAWVPHRSTLIFSASNEAAKINTPPDVTIINYDILAKHVDELRARGLKAVVFDEAHLLKTAKCQRTTAAKKLRNGVDVRLLLTGTPVLNSPSELLAPLAILGRLDDLGGFWHFVERYCGGKEVERFQRGSSEKRKGWDISGASHLPELAARLRATCMVRRRKKDVLPELPSRTIAMQPVELADAERREYDAAQKDVLKWIAKRAGRDPAFRASIAGLDEEARISAVLTRAQNAADRAAQAEELVKIEALKQISARGKLAHAQEWIENSLATNEKLIVFAWHQHTLDALAERFPGAGVISGETPVARRKELVDDFQKGEGRLMLLNLQAGGVGLTLTAASNALFLELPWTPALLDQAIDRLHRIGQQRAVTAWMMMGRRTIDFAIWKLIQHKRKTVNAGTA